MEKHRFGKDVKNKIKPLYTKDNYHGVLALVEDILVITAAVLLSFYSYWMYPVSWFIIGSRQRALATILHESSHKTLTQDKKLNYALGLFSGFFIFQKYSEYYKSHVIDHHKYLGDHKKDPDYVYHISMGLYDENVTIWTMVSQFINPFWILRNSHKSLYYLFKNRFCSNPDKWTLMFLGLWILLLSVFYYTSSLGYFVIFWFVPFMSSFQVVNWFCELSEHYPKVKSNTLDLKMSRNRLCSKFESFFFGMHNENYHLVHHLNPGIPFWNLPKAHDIYKKDILYKLINKNTGGIFSTSKGSNAIENIAENI